jgi:hypothetical protein
MALRLRKDRSKEPTGGADTPKKPGRLGQIRAAYRMTKKSDPQLGLILAAVGFLAFAVLVALGLLAGQPVYFGIIGVLVAIIAMTIVFGRRAERAAYRQVEGQPGAAAAVLNSLRRGWTVTPAVAVNRQQDVLHRAVGRPGIVLVGEGAPSRLGALFAAERKKMARVLPDVPVHEMQVGDAEGQVPLRKVNRSIMKMRRSLSAAQVGEVNRRLKAMGAMNIPVPKGPLPRNIKMPRGPRG